jgi:hypothetical protein
MPKKKTAPPAAATATLPFPAETGGTNFADLLASLEHKDPSRMSKALDMLKKERFKLFAQVEGDSIIGVVRSQSEAERVYSCRLTSAGSYACCTQNLNACGGLRGALCKHLLVLIVGLARAGQIDPAVVDAWVKASRAQKPELDRDIMTATFLRHKGAEAGEIDWRPTETIPEDYYAL